MRLKQQYLSLIWWENKILKHWLKQCENGLSKLSYNIIIMVYLI